MEDEHRGGSSGTSQNISHSSSRRSLCRINAKPAARPFCATAASSPGWRRELPWLTAFRGDSTLPPARIRPKEMAMKWRTPVIIEIAVGLEINAYACAEVK
jgi:coenzyme PQQ precursor peptide PqqA